MIVSSSALAANIANAAGKLKAALPAGFSAALAASRNLPHEADSLAGHLDAMHAAALTAIAAGKDPADDADVQRLAVYRALSDSGLRQAAEQRAGDDIRTAIAEFADDIISTWADAIAEDLDVLSTAAAELDLADLADADHTLLRRSGKLNLWADACDAADRADHALRGVDAILFALALDRGKAHRPLLLAPDIDLAAFSNITGRDRSSAWTVARTGAPLRLATLPEFTAAIGRITAAQQELQRRLEAERLDAQRAHRGAAPREQLIG